MLTAYRVSLESSSSWEARRRNTMSMSFVVVALPFLQDCRVLQNKPRFDPVDPAQAPGAEDHALGQIEFQRAFWPQGAHDETPQRPLPSRRRR